MKYFWLLAAFGLLFLARCMPPQPTAAVYDARGVRVGEVHLINAGHGTVTDADGRMKGILEVGLVRTTEGTIAGRLLGGSGSTSVLDASGKEIATIQQDTDCYDRNDRLLGRINVRATPDAAGAACLLLLINR